eukprot:2133887-Rhodomonas_salina.1
MEAFEETYNRVKKEHEELEKFAADLNNDPTLADAEDDNEYVTLEELEKFAADLNNDPTLDQPTPA